MLVCAFMLWLTVEPCSVSLPVFQENSWFVGAFCHRRQRLLLRSLLCCVLKTPGSFGVLCHGRQRLLLSLLLPLLLYTIGRHFANASPPGTLFYLGWVLIGWVLCFVAGGR